MWQEILINLVALLTTGLTVYRITVRKRKKEIEMNKELVQSVVKRNENIEKMIENINETNKQLKENINLWLVKFEQAQGNIIIKNKEQMNILREGLNTKMKSSWISAMVEIQKENSLDNKDWVLDKIKTKTNNIIHKYENKFKQIEGTENYLIGTENILNFLEEKNIYEKIYNILIKKSNTEIDRRLSNQWDVTQSQIYDKYSEII